jgi:hypothetical protein
MLRQAERHRQHTVEQAEEGSAGHGRQHPKPEVPPLVDGQPTDHGAKSHDPLDAEVEHAHTFAKEGSQRSEQERRGDAQDGGPETGAGENIERRHQGRTL